jgi:hypothetical protein
MAHPPWDNDRPCFTSEAGSHASRVSILHLRRASLVLRICSCLPPRPHLSSVKGAVRGRVALALFWSPSLPSARHRFWFGNYISD